MRFLVVLLFLVLNIPTAIAEITVVDGDSLEINGKRIRMLGIDAPELFQECQNANGKSYKCGLEALAYLQKVVDEAQNEIVCKKNRLDIYKRELGICYAGKIDINAEMVRQGWAMTYRDDRYQNQEQEAKKAQRGIWQGKFMRPELYRILNKYRKE